MTPHAPSTGQGGTLLESYNTQTLLSSTVSYTQDLPRGEAWRALLLMSYSRQHETLHFDGKFRIFLKLKKKKALFLLNF